MYKSLSMLSRVADSLYWLSRYVERAENIARFIDVNMHLMLDLPIEFEQQWHPLVTVTGDYTIFKERYSEATQDAVIEFLTFDSTYSNSIVSCLRAARLNARSIREVISSEMWESVNEFYLFIISPEAKREAFSNPHAFFSKVKQRSQEFIGIREVTFTHGEGWNFMRMGVMIERAEKTSRILDVKYFILLPKVEYIGTPYDNIQWSAVLKSASALEMYLKCYHHILPNQVADFLIHDKDFPRSIRYCLDKAEQALHAVCGSTPGTFSNEAERRLGRLRAELDYSDINEVLETGLHEYLDALQVKLNQVDTAIFNTFIAIRPPDLITRI